MKKILVTGATGLIGRYMCDLLSQKKCYEVFMLTHNPKHCGANIIYCDLSQPFYFYSFPKRIDIVVHLAMSNNYADFPNSSLDICGINISATQRLLEYARHANASKFIFLSSGGVYGTAKTPFSEESLTIESCRQLPFFLTSKLCAEFICNSYTPFFDVDILRVFFAYGCGQKKNMLIARLIENVKNGIPLFLNGADGILLNPVHASDVALAIFNCFSLDGSHTFNIGGAEIVSIKELGFIIGRLLNMEPNFIIKDMLSYPVVGDISHMQNYLHIPRVSLENGIRDFILYDHNT